MIFYIIIPAHNEEAYLKQTLQSLVNQTLLPKKLVVVNDNSTDGTQEIIDSFSSQFPFISSIQSISSASHAPGSKVINAFNIGLQSLDDNYDIICKFDADLIFPKNYLSSIQLMFEKESQCGMAGGFCYIQKNGNWILEDLTNQDHIRGALKAYRKSCFKIINGLKNSMGWDTVDELLAQYHGWKVCTNTNLQVKHLKPTGASYISGSKYKQGEAFYSMRYGWVLSNIASIKLALKKKSFIFYINCLKGYFAAYRDGKPFMVSNEEGKFIRKLRWKKIISKFYFYKRSSVN